MRSVTNRLVISSFNQIIPFLWTQWSLIHTYTGIKNWESQTQWPSRILTFPHFHVYFLQFFLHFGNINYIGIDLRILINSFFTNFNDTCICMLNENLQGCFFYRKVTVFAYELDLKTWLWKIYYVLRHEDFPVWKHSFNTLGF